MTDSPAGAPPQGPAPGRVERLIGGLATRVGSTIGYLAEHGVLFAVFLIAWLGFGVALITNPELLAQLWSSITAMSLIAQLVLWLLFLPLMAGLWVWQASGWPDLVRLAVIIALAAWTLLVMRPRWLTVHRSAGNLRGKAA